MLIPYSSDTTSLYVQYIDDTEHTTCNRAMLCQAFNATYNLEATFINQIPSFNPSIISYHQQIPSNLDPQSINNTLYPDPMTAFFAIKESLYGYVIARIEGNNITESRLSMTNLLNGTGGVWNAPNISTKLPELMSNLSISSVTVSNITGGANCTITEHGDNTYSYTRRSLILPYGCAVAVVLIGLFVGVSAGWDNGVPIGGIFSQLLVTVSFSARP
jgi:hypothetical protein